MPLLIEALGWLGVIVIIVSVAGWFVGRRDIINRAVDQYDDWQMSRSTLPDVPRRDKKVKP